MGKQLRSIREQGRGFTGGGEDHHFHVKCWCRLVLLMVETVIPDAVANVTVGRVLDWTPDENEHLDPLSKLTGAQCCHKLGIPILMLGCWACMMASRPPLHPDEVKQARALPHQAVMEPALAYRRAQAAEAEGTEDPCFPPGPRQVIKEALAMAGERAPAAPSTAAEASVASSHVAAKAPAAPNRTAKAPAASSRTAAKAPMASSRVAAKAPTASSRSGTKAPTASSRVAGAAAPGHKRARRADRHGSAA